MAGDVRIADKVTYTGLTAGETYRLTASIVDTETGEPVTVDDKPVTATHEFTAQTADGYEIVGNDSARHRLGRQDRHRLRGAAPRERRHPHGGAQGQGRRGPAAPRHRPADRHHRHGRHGRRQDRDRRREGHHRGYGGIQESRPRRGICAHRHPPCETCGRGRQCDGGSPAGRERRTHHRRDHVHAGLPGRFHGGQVHLRRHNPSGRYGAGGVRDAEP